MEEESTNNLQSIFESIEDPRVERTKRHQLLDIILIAILGVLCGAEGWVDIENIRQHERGVVENLYRVAQRHSLTRYIRSRCLRASIPSSLRSVF